MKTAVIMAVVLMLGSAAAQRLGGGLGGALGPVDNGVRDLGGAVGSAAGTLDQDARDAVNDVVRDSVGRPEQSGVLARDPQGAAIVRHRIVAVSPDPQALAIVARLGFSVVERRDLAGLGLVSLTLKPPGGMDDAEALAALRKADPAGTYDYDHVYDPEQDGGAGASPAPLASVSGAGLRIGMIDGGLDPQHPALAGKALVVRNFAGDGASPPTEHGLAVAALLVGQQGDFSGYLPGARLFAADVYGGAADGGSAVAIAAALDWMVQNQVPVTNISLAGPDNALLAAAVKAFLGKGFVLAAAVGNDGPAGPAHYPASYPGVIGVTSVDGQGALEIDANRHGARFAAVGVGVRTAVAPRYYQARTGTSFAVPLVAARMAVLVGRVGAVEAEAELARDGVGLAGGVEWVK